MDIFFTSLFAIISIISTYFFLIVGIRADVLIFKIPLLLLFIWFVLVSFVMVMVALETITNAVRRNF